MGVAVGVIVRVGVDVKVGGTGVVVTVGVDVGGTGVRDGVMVKVWVGVKVGTGVGKAICAPKDAPAPVIPIKITIPSSSTIAPTVYPNNVNGRKPRITKVNAANRTPKERYWANTTKPSGNKNGSPLPSPIPAAEMGRYNP
jgi:hypothetical protein